MKKIYTRPEVEVTTINSADVISLSSATGALVDSDIKSVKKSAIDF
jgi:hypothetical protein